MDDDAGGEKHTKRGLTNYKLLFYVYAWDFSYNYICILGGANEILTWYRCCVVADKGSTHIHRSLLLRAWGHTCLLVSRTHEHLGESAAPFLRHRGKHVQAGGISHMIDRGFRFRPGHSNIGQLSVDRCTGGLFGCGPHYLSFSDHRFGSSWLCGGQFDVDGGGTWGEIRRLTGLSHRRGVEDERLWGKPHGDILHERLVERVLFGCLVHCGGSHTRYTKVQSCSERNKQT